MSKIQEIKSKLKYHKISEVKIIERKIKDEKVIYRVESELRENQELIASNENQAGRFILATNILDMTTEKATVKNHLNKLTERPTLRWIFQCFQGIHLLTYARS